MTDDDRFIAEFEARRWPLDQWHHRDHVKLAYLYLVRFGVQDAADRLRIGIRAHNAAHQIPDLPTSGYHETMTQAWLRLVHFVVTQYGPAESADSFVDAHPELLEKKTLRLFYSPQRFMSPQAKSQFLEPDLTAFPRHPASLKR